VFHSCGSNFVQWPMCSYPNRIPTGKNNHNCWTFWWSLCKLWKAQKGIKKRVHPTYVGTQSLLTNTNFVEKDVSLVWIVGLRPDRCAGMSRLEWDEWRKNVINQTEWGLSEGGYWLPIEEWRTEKKLARSVKVCGSSRRCWIGKLWFSCLFRLLLSPPGSLGTCK